MIKKNIRNGKLSINKRLIALMIAGSCTFSLAGCEKKHGNTLSTVTENTKTYNHIIPSQKYYKIINVRNTYGEEKFYFAKKRSLKYLKDGGYDEYDKYIKDDVLPDDIYLYFDMINGDVLSVRYEKPYDSKSKDDKITYAINTILSEDIAYNYAELVYGKKEFYTEDEMISIIDNLNNNKEDSNNKVR